MTCPISRLENNLWQVSVSEAFIKIKVFVSWMRWSYKYMFEQSTVSDILHSFLWLKFMHWCLYFRLASGHRYGTGSVMLKLWLEQHQRFRFQTSITYFRDTLILQILVCIINIIHCTGNPIDMSAQTKSLHVIHNNSHRHSWLVLLFFFKSINLFMGRFDSDKCFCLHCK